MAVDDEDPGLLAIQVDADDYAETAAGDTPTVPRTYQSEAEFQAIRAKYSAKTDGVEGRGTYEDLVAAVPMLRGEVSGDGARDGWERVKLGKKDAQLLGYAAGQMYLERRYREAAELCERVREQCEVDAKTGEALERWIGRCRERTG